MEYNIVQHPEVGDVVVIYTHSDHRCDEVVMVPHSMEVIVDEICGTSVLRGADVFACGILGTPPGIWTIVFLGFSIALRILWKIEYEAIRGWSLSMCYTGAEGIYIIFIKMFWLL